MSEVVEVTGISDAPFRETPFLRQVMPVIGTPTPQLAFNTAWLPDTETSVTSHAAQAAPLAASPSINMARAASLFNLWDKFMFNPLYGETAFKLSV